MAKHTIPIKALDRALIELGVPVTKETRALLHVLAADSVALHKTVRTLSELRIPNTSTLPDVDGQVQTHMTRAYKHCVVPGVLDKKRKLGKQNQLLLSVLISRLGQPVPLQELLLLNGLHNAT